MRKGNAILDTIVTYSCAEGVEALFLCTGWCSRGRGAYLNFIEHLVYSILISLYRSIQCLLALVEDRSLQRQSEAMGLGAEEVLRTGAVEKITATVERLIGPR